MAPHDLEAMLLELAKLMKRGEAAVEQLVQALAAINDGCDRALASIDVLEAHLVPQPEPPQPRERIDVFLDGLVEQAEALLAAVRPQTVTVACDCGRPVEVTGRPAELAELLDAAESVACAGCRSVA